MAPQIYQIKVTLRHTRPPIWRRLLVPADYTLARLHQVLQNAMGWYDCHLHEFEIDKERFGDPDLSDDFMDGPEVRSERGARLGEVLGGPKAKGLYTYDFGDTWEHTITVEKVLPMDPERAYPVCIAGAGACPPEDCGGPSGFYDMLEAIADPTNEAHEETRKWCGPFDAKAFSVEEVNSRLGPKRSRKKK